MSTSFGAPLYNPTGPSAGPFSVPMTRGLERHGYVLNKNLQIEARGAEGHKDRLQQLLTDLVANKVQIIIALRYLPALAAKRGTTLPVVEFSGGGPVATGLATP